MTDSEQERFYQAYSEAVIFTDTGESGQPASYVEWSLEADLSARADCQKFFNENKQDVLDYGIEYAAHDFWFTRNGHGVGFWENDHGTPEICDRLDAAARAFGETSFYLGDDELGYFTA